MDIEKEIFRKISNFVILLSWTNYELENIIIKNLMISHDLISTLYYNLSNCIKYNRIPCKNDLILINKIWNQIIKDYNNFGTKKFFNRNEETIKVFNFLIKKSNENRIRKKNISKDKSI